MSCLRLRQRSPPTSQHPTQISPQGDARPYSPWQNSKVERINRTFTQEWRCSRARKSEASGAEALLANIERCIGSIRTARAGPPSHVAHPERKQPIGTQHLVREDMDNLAPIPRSAEYRNAE